MTDDERREAERSAQEYFSEDGPGYIGTLTFLAGYSAACEAKRAEYDEAWQDEHNRAECFRNGCADLKQQLKTERARSAKLIESIRALGPGQPGLGDDPAGLIAKAVAEYEASRD